MSLAARLEGALAAAAGALEAGDSKVAAEAAALAARVCQEAKAAQAEISAADRARLFAAFRRAAAAAAAAQERLAAKMSQASLGRRASSAYRR